MSGVHGPHDMIRLLLTEGADVNIRDRDGRTALNRVAEFKSEPTARPLLEYGADLEVPPNRDVTAQSLAARSKRRTEQMVLLLSKRSPNMSVNEVARAKYEEEVREVRATNAGYNLSIREVRDSRGWDLYEDFGTRCRLATSPETIHLLDILFKHGSDLKAVNQHERDSPHNVAFKGRFDSPPAFD